MTIVQEKTVNKIFREYLANNELDNAEDIIDRWKEYKKSTTDPEEKKRLYTWLKKATYDLKQAFATQRP